MTLAPLTTGSNRPSETQVSTSTYVHTVTFSTLKWKKITETSHDNTSNTGNLKKYINIHFSEDMINQLTSDDEILIIYTTWGPNDYFLEHCGWNSTRFETKKTFQKLFNLGTFANVCSSANSSVNSFFFQSAFCIIIIRIFFFSLSLIRTFSARPSRSPHQPAVPSLVNIPENNSRPKSLIIFFTLADLAVSSTLHKSQKSQASSSRPQSANCTGDCADDKKY